MKTHAIHHVTAIAGEARRNLDFYTGTLGLRLVKRTVNFDDPSTYHLYFGDETGSPGTIMTFFPWAQARAGRTGIGEQDETAFRIPLEAIDFWAARLRSCDAERVERFGEPALLFRDPDGLRLALVGVAGAASEPAWVGGGIAAAQVIRGFHGVRLLLDDAGPTAAVLTETFGFVPAGEEGGTLRFRAAGVTFGAVVDIHAVTGVPPARSGRGTIHHLAFRAADDAEQADLVAKLARDHGLHATEQRDRDYFRSVYFRSPGGVLFEIATDAPGFAIDEPPAELGGALKLPRFLQPHRAAIEAALPTLG